MNAKKMRVVAGIVVGIGILTWVMIVIQLVALGKQNEDAQAAAIDATVVPSVSAMPTDALLASPSISEVAPTDNGEPSPTEDLSGVFYSDEDGWVTVVSDELRIRSEANLDCEVYEMVTKGTGFVWMKELTTEEWVAIWYKSNQVAYLAAEYVEIEVNQYQNVYMVEDSINEMVLPTLVPSVTSALSQKLDGDETNMVITPIPTATNTPTPTPTPTATPSPTPKPTATNTPTPKPTATPTPKKTIPTEAGDEDLLTALIVTEAGNNYAEMVGVGQVVINRMLAHNASMYSIIYAPNQFSVVANGRLASAYEKWINKTYSSSYKSMYENANKAAKEVLAGGANEEFTWLFFRVTSSYYEEKYPNHVVIGSTIFHDGKSQ